MRLVQLRPRRPPRSMPDRLRSRRRQRHDPRLHHRPPLQPAGLQPLEPHPHVLHRDAEPHRQQLHARVPEPIDPHQERAIAHGLPRPMPRPPHQLLRLHDHQGATRATSRHLKIPLGCRPATPPTTYARGATTPTHKPGGSQPIPRRHESRHEAEARHQRSRPTNLSSPRCPRTTWRVPRRPHGTPTTAGSHHVGSRIRR